MLFRSNRDNAAAYRKHEREKKKHEYEQRVCEVELTLLVLLSASGDPRPPFSTNHRGSHRSVTFIEQFTLFVSVTRFAHARRRVNNNSIKAS